MTLGRSWAHRKSRDIIEQKQELAGEAEDRTKKYLLTNRTGHHSTHTGRHIRRSQSGDRGEVAGTRPGRALTWTFAIGKTNRVAEIPMSAFGTKRTSRLAQSMSAFGGSRKLAL